MGGHLAAGEHVDQFEVVRLLGRGGNGEVYLARDLVLGRKVALKVLRPESFEGSSDVDRFLVEARATAKLSHPHIVSVYGAGHHEGRPYLALEYLDGETLRARIERDRPSIRESLRIALAIAEGLGEAHAKGVLHRDLKPENVMLPSDGRLRLVDFGLAQPIEHVAAAAVNERGLVSTWARLARPGSDDLAGTPFYMAPEQWRNEPLHAAADIWALGAIVFELLSGDRPFRAGSVSEMAALVRSDAPAPSLSKVGVPDEIARLVARALEKRPSERPSAEDFVRALTLAVHPGRALASELVERGPFLGLRSFTESDADLFFGREAEIVSFLARLQAEPMLAIVGPSGAGKSSFVRAGIIPRLLEQGAWSIVQLRPGARPFSTLAQKLIVGPSSGAGKAALGSSGRILDTADLADRLMKAPERLALELHRRAESSGSRVLLFVDQLEELHALCPDVDVRRRFMRAISTAADDSADPVRVIATLRDDFLGKLAEVEEARAAMGRIVVLRAPAKENLREVIARPVLLTQYAFDDPSLPDAIAGTVDGEAASLPLVQFACEALWERRDPTKKLLLRSIYEAIGGVEGALARHGDGLIERLAPQEVNAARMILVRMVTPEGTRRTISFARAIEGLDPIAEKVLDRLIEARLVTLRRGRSADEAGSGDVELAHESLTHTWTRLARWIEEGKEETAIVHELVQAAELWEKRGKREEEVWSGETLRDARSKVARLSTSPPEVISRFIESGVARERRRVWRRRAAVVLTLLVFAAASLFFYRQKEEARRARAIAEREGAEGAFNGGRFWEARAKLRAALEIEDSLEGRALFVRLEAEPLLFKETFPNALFDVAVMPDGGPLLLQAEARILALDTRTFEIAPYRFQPGRDHGLALSASGRWLAVGSFSGRLSLIDVASGAQRELQGHRADIWRLAFSPDEKHLASTSWDRTAAIWSVPDGALEHTLHHDGRAYGVAYSKDGKRLATSSFDGTARIWDAATGEAELVLRGHTNYVNDVQFALGDSLLVSIARDQRIGLWDARTGAPRGLFSGSTDYPWLAVGPPEGTVIAVESRLPLSDQNRVDSRIRWLEASNLQSIRTWGPIPSSIERAVFDPVHRWLIAVGQDQSGGELFIFRIDASGWRDWSRSWTAPFYRAISPDGGTIVMARGDGASVRDVASGRIIRTLNAPGVHEAAFSSDGGTVAFGAFDGRVCVVSLSGGAERCDFTLDGLPMAFVFSEDGRDLFGAGSRGEVREWDLGSGKTEDSWRFSERPNRLVRVGGSTMVLTLGGTLARLEPGGRVTNLKTDPSIESAAPCPSGQCLVLAHAHQKGLERFDPRTGASSEIATAEAYRSQSSCLATSPGSKLIFYRSMTGVRTVDVDSLEDRLFLAGHGTACAFSGSGRTVALDRETSTEILTLSGRRRLWRAPALLPGAEVLTHTGWHRLDRSGSERPLEGDAAPWRKALSSSSEYIEISRDRRALCSATSSGAVELWDLENGERLFESAGGARVGLAALPRGCVALSGTEVQLYLETGSPRSIASDGVALAQDGDVVLVATKDRILEVDRTGAVRTVAPSEPSVTAVGRFEGGVVLGLADGRILSGAGRAPFDGPTRRSVTVLSAGPRGTIIAGYLDGTIVILDPRTDRMLLAARLDGSINHILLEDSVLYATTVVGDHAAMDLGALRADYCTLMKALWASSPNLWEQGRAQPRPRPVDHACAR